jgi:hypothetical protein
MREIKLEDLTKKEKIKIVGIEFELNINDRNVEEIKKVDENSSEIFNVIDKFLGNGATEKIKEELSKSNVELDEKMGEKILLGIYEAYVESISKQLTQPFTNIEKKINHTYSNFNRYKRKRRY